MNYYFVFQNKTFEKEYTGKYLWAPKFTSNGKCCSHWANMKNIKTGDIIFSGFNQNIVSINVATSDCYEHTIPQELLKENLWTNLGMKVDCKYYKLSNPISYNIIINTVLKLQPKKYAPFNRLGKGNTGYLFDLNEKTCEYLLSVLSKKDKYIISNLNISILEKV